MFHCLNRRKKPKILLFVIMAGFILMFGCEKNKTEESPMPPKAEKIPKELTLHGDTRIDPYYWMNQREDPKVIEHLKAENAYTEAVMEHTKELQDKLYNEIIGRIKKTDMSVPYFENGYYYYSRYEEGDDYPVYARKKESLDAEEEIMLDVQDMAEGHSFYSVTGLSVSPNNQYLSYGVDTVSRRKYTIHIKDLTTGDILQDEIPTTTGRAVWANDNKTLFYTTKDDTLRAFKIFRHILGTDLSQDVEIYHEKDNTFSTTIYKTKSDRFLIIASYQTLSTEMRYLDADDPLGEFQVFQEREKDHEYSISHYKDKFYIVTNWQAKNFRLMETEVNQTEKSNWKEVLPHRKKVLLNGIDVFEDYLVLNERKDGLRQIRIMDQSLDTDQYIPFEEEAYVAYPTSNPEFDTQTLRYSYSSLTTPRSVYDYNMKTGEKILLKQQEVLGDFDPHHYQSKRLTATARDGAQIPISMVYRKGLTRDSNNPLLLYGYGSYGASMDPSFRSDRLSLLDRGFIYAMAHIRGGSEMGRDWYEQGKLLNKKNTFTDFIDCGEFLIEEEYTNPDMLFAMGGSAGGLLMGAVLNMRPGLWKGVIAAVPWVDVVTTMLDESIPLTTGEFDEWGNPKDKQYYDYMLSYSPYDNVKAQDYPAILVTTGLHDSQVQYFEPTKWVAKLRDLKTDDNRIILDVDMESGHGGASGRFKRYKRTALEYAFMLDLIGISE
ncbi:MAG: prolyl oligopeptidase family serine peptidase [Candidatus Aminicenantes bacterium]|nr:prolyl oligopeptidase family serine peptidase [Candidatus Aminicenantes bacterium]